MAKKRTRDFGDVIRAKLAANAELAKAVEEESFNADIAQKVCDLRTEAKLTQKQLAEILELLESMDKYAIFREDPIFVKFMEETIKPNTADSLTLDFEMDPGKDVRFS